MESSVDLPLEDELLRVDEDMGVNRGVIAETVEDEEDDDEEDEDEEVELEGMTELEVIITDEEVMTEEEVIMTDEEVITDEEVMSGMTEEEVNSEEDKIGMTEEVALEGQGTVPVVPLRTQISSVVTVVVRT